MHPSKTGPAARADPSVAGLVCRTFRRLLFGSSCPPLYRTCDKTRQALKCLVTRLTLRVPIVCCSPAASRRGLGPVEPARKSGDRPPQNCPAFPPGLAGGSTTYLETFRPTALVSPAGRCDGSTRRAVRPSKPLKTRRRYPWRAGGFCAIEYARTEPGQPSRPARAAAQTEHPEHPEPDNAAVAIFLFRTTEIRDVRRSIVCTNHHTPAPVLGDSPSCARSH